MNMEVREGNTWMEKIDKVEQKGYGGVVVKIPNNVRISKKILIFLCYMKNN